MLQDGSRCFSYRAFHGVFKLIIVLGKQTSRAIATWLVSQATLQLLAIARRPAMLGQARLSTSTFVHRGWNTGWRRSRALAGRPGMSRKFGPWDIDEAEIFTETELSFAFVNLKPVVPGHLLVSPKRVAPRFHELRESEVADLWCLAQKVGLAAEKHWKADSLTLAIQDGPQAGQSVPHVHIHVLPRRPRDFENNDDIYTAIDESSKQMDKKSSMNPDQERQPRTHEEMSAEASELRPLFQ